MQVWDLIGALIPYIKCISKNLQRLDQPTLVIFSSFLKKIASGSLIMYLGEFDISTNIYVVHNQATT